MKRGAPEKIVSSLFGLGYAPFAPGTFGTAGAAGIYFFFLSGLGRLEFAAFWAVFSAFSVFVCGRAASAFGEKDPQTIVIDEASGFFTAMLFSSGKTAEIAAGFLLFRVFDIAKIPPSRRIEKLSGGWGIVMDDIYAGFLAALCIAVLKVSGII